MKGLKLFKRDFSMGICHNAVIFLIPIIVAVAQCNECYNLISYLNEEEMMQSSGTILDYYLHCTQGMFVFHFDPKEYFTIPIYWFIFQMCISYFVGYYAHEDFSQNGRAIFLAVKDRKSWWNSKCVWCVTAVICNYILYITVIILTAIFFGAEGKLNYTTDFVVRVFDANILHMSNESMVVVLLIVPFLVTLGLCMLQILLGFFVTPVVSFACICGGYVLSAYYTEWFLLGNYTMWLRSSYVTVEGVSPLSGGVLATMLVTCVWYIGRLYFETKDIM